MQSRPKLIGVTGGIGSGKSTVCKIFETLGHKVFYADNQAKWLMKYNEGLKVEIIKVFGENAYLGEDLNRSFIAERAFHKPALLEKLNLLVHPVVAKDLASWVTKNNTEQLLFDEAALLFEVGSYKKMDKNILIKASVETRIDRVLKRDPHRTRASVEKIIGQQMEDVKKIPLADYIIENDGDRSVIEQTMEIYDLLISRHK